MAEDLAAHAAVVAPPERRELDRARVAARRHMVWHPVRLECRLLLPIFAAEERGQRREGRLRPLKHLARLSWFTESQFTITIRNRNSQFRITFFTCQAVTPPVLLLLLSSLVDVDVRTSNCHRSLGENVLNQFAKKYNVYLNAHSLMHIFCKWLI